METEVLLLAGGIFLLRFVNMTIATVRMLILIQGRRLLSAGLAFIESMVFIVALGGVVSQLDNVLNMIAYAGGFSFGTYFGMWLEDRLITNFLTVNIISPEKAHKIAEAVRAAGFGATENAGLGADGLVGGVRVVARRREVQNVIDVAANLDPDAFITLDETRAVRHGYLRPGRPSR